MLTHFRYSCPSYATAVSRCRLLSTSIRSNEPESLRRSLLYVPVSSAKMLDKSTRAVTDTIIYDLEDTIPPAQKALARTMVAEFVTRNSKRLEPELAVRVNPTDSQEFTSDVHAVLSTGVISTIVLPNVHSISDLDRLVEAVRSSGASPRPLNIIASVESAKSLWNVGSIAQWRTDVIHVSALLFAGQDYCADTYIVRTRSRTELLYARSHVVNAAKAFGIQAIDMACVNYKDPDLLREESEDGRRLGFDGKQAIHPNQTDAIREIFSPSSNEVSRAKAILEQMETAHADSRGAFGLSTGNEEEIEMIDEPMVKQAQRILERARRAGTHDE